MKSIITAIFAGVVLLSSQSANACVTHEGHEFCSGDRVFVADPRSGRADLRQGEIIAINRRAKTAAVNVLLFQMEYSYPIQSLAPTRGCLEDLCVGDLVRVRDPRPGRRDLRTGELVAINPFVEQAAVKIDLFQMAYFYPLEAIYVGGRRNDEGQDAQQTPPSKSKWIYRYND